MWFPYSLPAQWKAESERECVNESLADQREREFVVGFYLHNPVSREWDVELRLEEPQWVETEDNGQPISVGYCPNEKEQLAEIICRAKDTEPKHAVRRCYSYVSELLSCWSTLRGRGFAIGGFRIADLKHEALWRVLPHWPST